jgi:multicomponent Na+:H+ antiporter subunit D
VNAQTAILGALAVPLIGAFFIGLAGSRPNLREAITLTTATLLFALVASLYPDVAAGGRPSVTLLKMMPDLGITFTVEPLGLIFAGIASFLWIVTSVYAIGYMRGHHEQNQTRFYVFFAISLAATMGIAFAGNMLTLFVFYEALTLATFPLVTHAGTEEAKRAGRIYLGILLTTSILFLLLAMVWTWELTGTLDFTSGGILKGRAPEGIASILLLLYAFGTGKAALMPFHRWLPAAMVAPTPVSALLHAVAVVKAGVFTILKVSVYIFGTEFLASLPATTWLQLVAAGTLLIASLVAMSKDNLKARLAYSTISQLSYIVLAAMLATSAGVVGGALHMLMHAFGKITLFFCAGAIMVASHKTEISQLKGIGRRMPWTMGAFAIASLSMIGVPPTGGFISKWFILTGAIDVGSLIAVGVLIASTLLNAAYLLPIVYSAFFHAPEESDSHHEHGEAPFPMLAALVLTATATVILFFMPALPLDLASQILGDKP